MALSSSFSTDPNVLVGIAPPDSVRGYYGGDEQLGAWLRHAPLGHPVTLVQHNAIVASLAWCQSILATTPSKVMRLSSGGTPWPFGVSRDGNAVVIGTTSYATGDIVLPIARAAGAEAVQGLSPAGMLTVTEAQRRTAFDAATRCLENLRLYPQNLVAAPAGSVGPAGFPLAAAGIAVAVAGAAIYAAYSAYVAGQVAEANASVERVRIQGNAQVAVVTAQTHAQLQAFAMRLAYAQQTGTMPAPSPIEGAPIVVPQINPPPPGASTGWSPLEIAGAALGALGAVGLGVWASTTTTPDRRAW